jgi:hypothetical protein
LSTVSVFDATWAYSRVMPEAGSGEEANRFASDGVSSISRVRSPTHVSVNAAWSRPPPA